LPITCSYPRESFDHLVGVSRIVGSVAVGHQHVGDGDVLEGLADGLALSVTGLDQHFGAVLASDLASAVGRVAVDDDDVRVPLLVEALDHVGNRGRLVERRDENADVVGRDLAGVLGRGDLPAPSERMLEPARTASSSIGQYSPAYPQKATD